MNTFNHFLIDRNGLWDEHCQEVRDKGRADASPIARLIHSCEIGDGINQHASEDLKAVSALIAAQQQALEAARDMVCAIENNWDISELDPDSYYETDLTGRVMRKLEAALTALEDK